MRVTPGQRLSGATTLATEAFAAIAVLAGVGVAVALDAPAPAMLLMAGLAPLVLFTYLSEVDRWSDQGVGPLVATFAISALFGGAWGLVVSRVALPDTLAAVLVVGIPLALALLVLWIVDRRGRYDEALDGYAFTASAVFGWYAAFLIVVTTTSILAGVFDVVSASRWLWVLVPDGLLRPIAVASAAGVIGVAAWTRRRAGWSVVGPRWVWCEVGCLLWVTGVGLAQMESAPTIGLLAVGGLAALACAKAAMRDFLMLAGEAPPLADFPGGTGS